MASKSMRITIPEADDVRSRGNAQEVFEFRNEHRPRV